MNGVSLAAGSTVTATATVDLGSSYGSTSEFGGNIVANEANLLISGSYVGNGHRQSHNLWPWLPRGSHHRDEHNGTIIRTSTMAGDMSKNRWCATAVISDAIQSLTSDGFTVGTNSGVNTSGVTYHWIAYGAGDNVDVGLYTGNGTSQTISNVGFQAETAFVLGESEVKLFSALIRTQIHSIFRTMEPTLAALHPSALITLRRRELHCNEPKRRQLPLLCIQRQRELFQNRHLHRQRC